MSGATGWHHTFQGQLEEALYAFGAEIESNAVEVYVSRLRKKFGQNVVRTIRGLGYRRALWLRITQKNRK